LSGGPTIPLSLDEDQAEALEQLLVDVTYAGAYHLNIIQTERYEISVLYNILVQLEELQNTVFGYEDDEEQE
jgi:hypothetical protein